MSSQQEQADALQTALDTIQPNKFYCMPFDAGIRSSYPQPETRVEGEGDFNECTMYVTVASHAFDYCAEFDGLSNALSEVEEGDVQAVFAALIANGLKLDQSLAQ